MLTKSWDCPACRRSLIVVREATKEVCPWCHASIEQRGEKLEVVAAQPPAPASEPPKPAAAPTESRPWEGYPYYMESLDG